MRQEIHPRNRGIKYLEKKPFPASGSVSLNLHTCEFLAPTVYLMEIKNLKESAVSMQIPAELACCDLHGNQNFLWYPGAQPRKVPVFRMAPTPKPGRG